MACIPGRLSRVKGSFDGGSTYDDLGSLVDASLNGNVDELECTSHQSNGIREYIPNHLDFTLDSEMRWDEDDPGQAKLLLTLIPSPASFKIRFMLEDVLGKRMFEADAFITSYSPASPLDDAAALSISLRLSAVAITTVPV